MKRIEMVREFNAIQLASWLRLNAAKVLVMSKASDYMTFTEETDAIANWLNEEVSE